MNELYHWSLESWGDAYPPENAEEIIERANAEIDAYIELHPDADGAEIAEFSHSLWEEFCTM